MFKEYRFLRLDWEKDTQMSSVLNEALESLDCGDSTTTDAPFEVVSVSALNDEVLVLVARPVKL